MEIKSLEKIALSARILAMDAVQEANSGHPGLPLGCAELGAYLYGSELKIDPANPEWINRDRFILSAGHGSMFLYAHLHMAGFNISLDDIKKFRKVGSKCPGHPEYGITPGVETTTGPLGQGLAMAVGFAIAETMLAAKFNSEKIKIIDHYTYVLVGDGCLQEGVSAESSSLAGHLKLNKLIVFYDSNKITIDGSTDLSFTEDVAKRYEAYGWQVLYGDMYNWNDLERLSQKAKAEKNKPSLIILKSIIGKGSPNKQNSHNVHGAPLGEDEIIKAKTALGVPPTEKFWVAEEARIYYKNRKLTFTKYFSDWQENFEKWQSENPQLSKEYHAYINGKAMAEVNLPSFKKEDKIATRNASGLCIAAIAKSWPNLIGGSADLTSPNVAALPKEQGIYSDKNRNARYIHYGIREFGMSAIANGLALHKGFKVFVSTFLVFSDYLRPALRLSALMKLPIIYVLTHDSIFIGEDGPTHQPVEHFAALRAIPGVHVFRPADAEETAVAWNLAIEKTDGPSVIALSRQNLPILEKDDPQWALGMGLGAYVVQNAEAQPDTVLIATGSEVSMALKAMEILGGKSACTGIRLISMPCRELFLSQSKAVVTNLIPEKARVIVVEAGVSQGWEAIAKKENIFSIERFGESGPGDEVAKHLNFTAENLAKLIDK